MTRGNYETKGLKVRGRVSLTCMQVRGYICWVRIPGLGKFAGGREHQMLPSCEGTLIGRKQEEKRYAYRDVHP